MKKRIHVRFFDENDRELLDKSRWEYLDADLELPHDYAANGLDTVVAEEQGGGPRKTIGSLTGTMAVICAVDPFINTREGDNHQVVQALINMDMLLCAIGQRAGALDAYVASPDHLKGFHEILKKCGYHETLEHCTVFRKPLVPDTMPLLGPIRDKLITSQDAGGPPPVAAPDENAVQS